MRKIVWNIEVPKHKLLRAVDHQQMLVCVNRWENLDGSKARGQGACTVVASCHTDM